LSPRLSVLDQSPIGIGGTAAQALRASVALAEQADRLGYHRYWVAEHHGAAGFAGVAPEILAARLLDATETLRIGTGGVLLPRYRPDKVAEVFQVLAALHPGRVDLGIGRAGGPAGDFPRAAAELLSRLADPSFGAPPPPVWLLGSSTGSARLSAVLRTSFCFAHFLNPAPAEAAYQAARDRDEDDNVDADARSGAEPSAQYALAVRVVTSEDEERAESLRRAYLLWRSRRDLGLDEPFPDPEMARRHGWSPVEVQRAEINDRALVTGTPEQVRQSLRDLAKQNDVDEIIINMLTHDPADRAAMLRLLAPAPTS